MLLVDRYRRQQICIERGIVEIKRAEPVRRRCGIRNWRACVALEVHVASLAVRGEGDGSLVGNGGTEPFRYVAEECVAIVGAAIVSF